MSRLVYDAQARKFIDKSDTGLQMFISWDHVVATLRIAGDLAPVEKVKQIIIDERGIDLLLELDRGQS